MFFAIEYFERRWNFTRWTTCCGRRTWISCTSRKWRFCRTFGKVDLVACSMSLFTPVFTRLEEEWSTTRKSIGNQLSTYYWWPRHEKRCYQENWQVCPLWLISQVWGEHWVQKSFKYRRVSTSRNLLQRSNRRPTIARSAKYRPKVLFVSSGLCFNLFLVLFLTPTFSFSYSRPDRWFPTRFHRPFLHWKGPQL